MLRTGYPPGVPCWIDVMQPDPDATMAFYGGLFGWTFEVRTPPEAPSRYAYALLDGGIVAGVGGPAGPADPAGWASYIWVDSADETVAAVDANGGKVLTPPADIPGAGRVALCADPEGAVFGLWQAAENRGLQVVNAAGSWNFSELHTAELSGAEAFYGAVFGWASSPFFPDDPNSDRYWRVEGYGEFLAAHDPEIRAWQEASAGQIPEGFTDAVATAQSLGREGPDAAPRWTVTFAVADADAAYARAVELGAETVEPLIDTPYTRQSTVRDPQGAVFSLSEYRPPADS
jgi:predicted enzyme related to lactoylglutathione lyase